MHSLDFPNTFLASINTVQMKREIDNLQGLIQNENVGSLV